MIWFLFLIVTRAAFSQPNEPRGESSLSVGNGGKTKCSRQLELDANPIREHEPTTRSSIVYSSMPTMHANEQLEDLVPSDRGGSMLAKPCPEPIVGRGLNGKLLPCHQFEGQAQSRIFSPCWSVETVNKVLEVCLIFNARILLSILT
jgi:DIS3-like exonuclease 2